MGWDAERAEDDYWADPENAIREAALDTGSGESWVDGGLVPHDPDEAITYPLRNESENPAEDARYLREIGYWNMTPAQRAGWANEMLVTHTTSPKEGPRMYDMDDMGALEMQDSQDEALKESARWAEVDHAYALNHVYGGPLDHPGTKLPSAMSREELRDLLDVFGAPARTEPYPLAGTAERLEREARDARKAREARKAEILLGRYEPVNPDRPEKSEAVRQSMLLNRVKGVLGGWGVSTDPAKEAAATVEELERLRDWSTARLAHLTRFPAEPELTDGPCVVSFTRTYGGRAYTYAALRVPSGAQRGTWVVTGPRSPAYVSWDELMIWVEKGTPSDQAVVISTVSSWILES